MPIFHEINKKSGVVVSSWVGEIHDLEVLPSYKQLYENSLWRPGFHELVDLRNVDINAVSSETIRKLSSVVEKYTKGKCHGFKTAVVANNDIPFGLARML